nr:MAG: ORF1 [Torque teno midi virus]
MAWPYRRRRWPFRRRRWRQRRWPRRRRYRRTNTRRRSYKTTRRNRTKRKRRRVRKKKKQTLVQWQPESVRRCKIIGYTPLILGCTGRQQNNYIYWQDYWTHPKCPAGGQFAVYKFSLALCYEDYKRHKNIWTKSNCDYDLCKYLYTKLYFFPHPEVDFVIAYSRSYPMVVNENTYMSTHPYYLMLRKHKLVVPSRRTNPRAKSYYTLKIKPPRQSINKWFFQKNFNDIGLFLLQASACDLTYPYLGSNSRNRLVTLNILNPNLWGKPNWGLATLNKYSFKVEIPKNVQVQTLINGQLKTYTIPNNFNTDNQHIHLWESGIFNSKFLNIQIWDSGHSNLPLPILQVQYNPMVDLGKGNLIYFISTLQDSWSPPKTDRLLVWADRPIWLMLFGLQDYILKAKGSTSALRDSICVIQSKAFYPQHEQIVVVGNNFLNGLTECGQQPTSTLLNKWFLTLEDQNQALNELVKSGPFIQKMDGFRCSWSLSMKYHSKWLWGGANPPLKPACDPYQQEVFPVPDSLKQALQIIDPKKQVPEALLHSWDFRRGFATKSALKRMQKNLSDAEISSTDSEAPLPKRRKADPPCYQEKEESLLQTIETICTQEETENPQLKKYQQQQQLKHLQLLKLIAELKKRQLNLQLMTGLME